MQQLAGIKAERVNSVLWEDFVNSYWRDWRNGDTSKGRDKLEEQHWMEEWQREHGLTTTQMPSPAELNKLRELREYLFNQVQQIVHNSAPEADLLKILNGYMADGLVIRQIILDNKGHTHISLLPIDHSWPKIMAEIAASFAKAIADMDVSRLRICGNPDCLWVYYDHTRNRSKHYCNDKACGNLMEVRRFRAQEKGEVGVAD